MRTLLSLLLCMLVATGCASLRKRSERTEARGEYYLAAEGYQKLYRRASPQKHKAQRAYYAYRGAECNLKLRHISKALGQYQQAERYGSTEARLALRLAYCLHALGRYEEASSYYRKHLATQPSDSLALVGLASCTRLGADSSQSRYTLQPLRQLHSTGGDASPCISLADDALYLLSRRKRGAKAKRMPRHGAYATQPYRLDRGADGIWMSKLRHLEGLRHPKGELEGLTLSGDGQHLYYIQRLDGACRIYRSQRLSTGAFSPGEVLAIDASELSDMQGLTLNASGTKLYFSARAKGQNHHDLFMQSLSGIQPIGKPQALPPSLNSLGDDISPYAMGDSLLYFATDGRLSYGGYDLYRAELLPNDTWRLSHLPVPLNSPQDEVGIAPDYKLMPEEEGKAYAERGVLLSSRSDARGRSQLYEYQLPREQAQIDGYVLDREGYGIPGASLRLVARYGHIGEWQATSRSDGSFTFDISPSNQYILHASCKGYLSQYAELKTTAEDADATYQIDFTLAQRGIPEVLRSLYFAFDSASILPESSEALTELVKILEDNPHIRLQLSAHTDRQGGDAYNQSLSERRALAVIKALNQRGISAERLSARGYAAARPYVVSRRTAEQYSFLSEGQTLSPEFIEGLKEAEHRHICDALNRRTEFLVLD